MLKKIWFYDNNSDNQPINPVNMEKIHWIKVNESLFFGKKAGFFVHPSYLQNPLNKDTFLFDENVDPLSGITIEHLDELIKSIDLNQVRAVVFDWDRTLTKNEGMYQPPNKISTNIENYIQQLTNKYPRYFSPLKNWSPKDFAVYLFQSPNSSKIDDRFKWLGVKLRAIQERKIPIFILTNNRIVKTPSNRALFSDFLKELGVFIPDNHIIFAPPRRKEDVITTQIESLLVKEGGKRKTRKRKRHKSRKKNKHKRTRRRN